MREILKSWAAPAALFVGVGLVIYATSGGTASKTEPTIPPDRERLGRLEKEVDSLRQAVESRPQVILPAAPVASHKPAPVADEGKIKRARPTGVGD